MTRTIFAAGAALAALAATPAAAQYGYGPYGYAQNPYGQAYGYGYGNPYAQQATNMAAQRCAAAVQTRLNNRRNTASILGALLGAQTQARVLTVTQVDPKRSSVRVRGLASSGRSYGYGPYGVGAYGAAGYGYQPDLSFRCDVDYRGYIRNVDIRRR